MTRRDCPHTLPSQRQSMLLRNREDGVADAQMHWSRDVLFWRERDDDVVTVHVEAASG